MVNPFEQPGAWLRCALHAHTTNSDGELAPPLLVRHYERAGFDVLAITDHWVRTDAASTDRLLVVPGVELNGRLDGSDRDAHVLALGVADEPERPAGEFPPLEAVTSWIEDNGGVAFLAHPYWSGLSAGSIADGARLRGLEVFNAGCELEVGRGLSAVQWDEALEAGLAWLGIATDDTHHPGFDSAYAWTWVRAEPTPAAVVGALRDGAFYSSTGPEIESLAIEDGVVEVRCSGARRITLLTGRMRGASVSSGRLGYKHRGEILALGESGSIAAARLTAPPHAPYGRLEVEDDAGRAAWTNPLWM